MSPKTINCALLTAWLLMVSVSGCVSWGNSDLQDDAMLDKIIVGRTTKADVVRLLGEPSTRRSRNMGPHVYEWWAYEYATSLVNPLEYLLLIGFFTNGIGTPDTRYDLHLFFDPDGTVRTVTRHNISYDLGAIRASRIKADTRTMTLSAPSRHEGVIRYRDTKEFQSR
jgi:hypothetical protein